MKQNLCTVWSFKITLKFCSHSDGLFEIPNESFPAIHAFHFLCGIQKNSARQQSPTHIIIHLFSGHSWGIYQRDTEGGIYQGIHHVHLENPVTRKALRIKKKKKSHNFIGREWMNGLPLLAREVEASLILSTYMSTVSNHWSAGPISFCPPCYRLKMPHRPKTVTT